MKYKSLLLIYESAEKSSTFSHMTKFLSSEKLNFWPRTAFFSRVIYEMLLILIVTLWLEPKYVLGQSNIDWSIPKQIPGYVDKNAGTPILVADQNRTVHAFSSQWLSGDDEQIRAVMYQQWTQATGWTIPVDILLSPLKYDARVLDAFLDQQGMMHVIFYGGDETEANIYYSKAPAVNAGQAYEWTTPTVVGEAANSPDAANLIGNGEGNLVIVYSGQNAGWGLYSIYSEDGGNSWTEPEPTFLTYGEYFPYILELTLGQGGSVHAIWDVRDLGGNGRQINYAQLDLDAKTWSELVTLEEVETGYGVLNPAIVEHEDELVIAYSGLVIQRSSDGGKTWSNPIAPFRLTGINGLVSFVEDSQGYLHLLWAQRITGNPDIHGVWHSVWQDGHWSEPEPVISGPPNHDMIGNDAFDPFDVRAIMSQGNVLLVSWRQDPGLSGNGGWFSYATLAGPELEAVPLPLPATLDDEIVNTTMPTPVPVPVVNIVNTNQQVNIAPEPASPSSPMMPIGASLALVVLFLSVVVIWKLQVFSRLFSR